MDAGPEASAPREALEGDGEVFTTGLILQELLQGVTGPIHRQAIVDRFAALPLLVPTRSDHVEAAALRNLCRRSGVRVGTVDALIAQLAIRFECSLLTADRDFRHTSRLVPLTLADT